MMDSLLKMNTASTSGSGSLPGNTVANPKGELKAITTRSGLVTDGPTVPTPPKSVNPEEDECVEETYTDPDLAEYTIKIPHPPVQKPKPLVQRHFVLHTRDSPPPHIPELKCKALADLGASINLMPLSVWKKLGLPDLIPTRMTLELANRAICTPDGIARDIFVPVASYSNHPHRESANLINIFNIPDIDSFNDIHPHFDDDPLSGSTTYSSNSLLEEFTDELALITYPLDYDDNRTCDIESGLREIEFLLYLGEDSDLKDSIDETNLANLDDLFVDPTPKMFTDEQPPDYSFPSRFDVYLDDFLEIESDANNCDNDSFDSKGEKIKEAELLIDQLDIPCDILSEILIHEKSVSIITRVAQEKKLAISYASLVFEDFDPPFYELLVFKEVPNSMILLPFSSENEKKVFKPRIYTSEKDLPRLLLLRVISKSNKVRNNKDIAELYLYGSGEDSDFKDSIDQSVLTHCDDLFVDPTPEMFTEEQPPDYSFPQRFDVYPDDFLEIESDATFDDDSFDSEGEKIKEVELLIDQLDLPCDILSECDSFNSQDFSRDDVLFSPDNEDKVFNPGILSREKLVKIITRVAQEKKLAVSFASWLFEDFDPPFSELFVFKEVPNSVRLLPFLSENEEKVFKPGIYIFDKFHCCFLFELSHPGFYVFKVNLIFLSLMKIFHVQNGKNNPPLDVLLFHFIPLDSLKYGENLVQLI
nr:reverse transcriptase domain-containing protein [Tanacetum cinerariifolium]